MAVTALAQFVHIQTAAGSTLFRWQNFWLTYTVDSHTYYAFAPGSIASSQDGAASEVSIEVPLNSENITLLENGASLKYTADISMYKFTPTADGSPPASKTKVAGFFGQIVGGSLSDTSISLSIGTSLDAVEAQIPPRIFTSLLIGIPPKL
tara:strand:- start:602 stop:1054 length:453 start_codon:yes stop_codon:yes gene_type:complete